MRCKMFKKVFATTGNIRLNFYEQLYFCFFSSWRLFICPRYRVMVRPKISMDILHCTYLGYVFHLYSQTCRACFYSLKVKNNYQLYWSAINYPPPSRHWFLNVDKPYVVLAPRLRKVTYSFFMLFLCFQWAHAIVPYTWRFINMSTDITCTQKLWQNVLFHCLTLLPSFLALTWDHSLVKEDKWNVDQTKQKRYANWSFHIAIVLSLYALIAQNRLISSCCIIQRGFPTSLYHFLIISRKKKPWQKHLSRMFGVIVNKPNKNNLISTADDCSKIASLKALIKTLKPVIICGKETVEHFNEMK